MMNGQKTISGVILAGGLARRMNYQDKGLICYKGKPMLSYAIAAMSAVTDQVIINANRNLEQYQQFGLPVITDQNKSFDGPLAGIFTAMKFVQAPILLVIPCDSPLISAQHLHKLSSALTEQKADVAVAFDGKRIHPVFLAIKTNLQSSLQDYLASNERKVESWLKRHRMVQVDFSNHAEVFTNINTMSELFELQVKIPEKSTNQ